MQSTFYVQHLGMQLPKIGKIHFKRGGKAASLINRSA